MPNTVEKTTIETDYLPMTPERAIDYLLQLEEVYCLDYCTDPGGSDEQRAVTLQAFAALGVPADRVRRQYR